MHELGEMFENGWFVAIYAIILVLITVEFIIRKSLKLGTLSHTPAFTVGWAVMMVRSALLLLAIPLLHPIAYFVVFFSLMTVADSLIGIYFYIKMTLFALWFFFILLKAWMERKYLNTKSAVVTLLFGFAVMIPLYIIFTLIPG